jgi:hypothetical protein
VAEALAFAAVEVPRGLEQEEAGVFESWALGLRQLSDLLPANLIEGVVEEALDVEAIEDDFGVGAAALDHLDVGVGHIEGNQLEAQAAFRTDLIEELLEGGDGSALPDPDGLAGFVIHDDCGVLVPALVGELVDTDEGERFESLGVQLLAHDSPGDTSDGHPRDPEELFDGGLVGSPSESGDLILEVTGEEGARSCPGDLLASDAAAATVDASNGSFEKDPDSQDSQVPPDAPLAVVDTAGDTTTPAASWHPSPRDDGDVDFSSPKPYRPNPEPLAREQPVE